MQITHKITLSGEELEALVWEQAEKTASEYCDELNERNNTNGYAFKSDRQNREVTVLHGAKKVLRISVPTPGEVRIGKV